jgi:hypothetical protein
MKKFRVLALVMVLLLAFSITGYAKGIEVSGSINSDLVGDTDNGDISDREKVNLVLERGFGFDANMHLDLEIESDHNDQTETKFHEAYLNYYTQNMDWRIGKQEISWGSAYKIKPTDYFNPKDLTSLKPLDDKLGVKAIKGTYYAPGRVEITGVVTPFFKLTDKTIENLSMQTGSSITNPSKIESGKDDVNNIQGGFKVTKRSFHGYDLSLSTYHGRDKLPVVDSLDTQATVQLVYPEVNRLGFDIIGDIGDIGVWTEMAYSQYKDDQYDNALETAIGADYKFDNDLYLVGQGYYKEGRTGNEAEVKAINLYTSKPVLDFHEIEVTTLYDIESETYLIEPQFNYSLANSVELQLGGTLVDSQGDGASSGLVSTLGQDRVYTRLNIEF